MDNFSRRLVGLTALTGLLIASTVHVLALFGVDASTHVRGIWLLHLGIFVVFFPLIFFGWRDFGSQPSLLQISSTLPRWAAIVGYATLAYAAINFIIFLAGTGGGSPVIRDGKYLLLNHGSLIRELTASEYVALQTNALRGFSGHWLAFFFWPAAYFLLAGKSNNSFKPKPLRGSA